MSDEALIGLVMSGDSGAFAPLVERHKRGIVNFVYASVRSAEDANDLAQETFMRAYAHLGTFNPRLAKFSTWLYQIARNVARTHLGKERRRPQTQDLYQDETLEQKVADTSREAAPEATMIAHDEDRAVRVALAEIPEKMRVALVLRFFRHLEYQEIADTMHETLGNTKTLIHRGKAALAKVLLRERTSVTTMVGVTTSREDRREVLCL